MLIPSIDLLGGRVVQLVHGERAALGYDDAQPWIEKFARFPLVQLIDLDAAKGTGDNRNLVRTIARQLPVQVGGGIRTPSQAAELLSVGAKRVILGSVLYDADRHHVREGVATAFAEEIGAQHLVFGVDAREGRVAINGWKTLLNITPQQAVAALHPWCGAFLYTHIDTEGTMSGFPLDIARALAALGQRKLLAAGGIRSAEEVSALDAMGVDAVVGMAVYTGLLNLMDLDVRR
jgi:phosphoribosylformimino-5-aminoimidazole carboxamide ribotide isomerase